MTGQTAALQEARHECLCRVPAAVATLLSQRPQLVSPAVRCFYARGPDELKAAAAMRRFGSESRWCSVRVRFTKCLYAQLSKQQFYPPKGFELPAEGDKRFKAAERGLKLVAGFEMLYAADPPHDQEPACFCLDSGLLPRASSPPCEVGRGAGAGGDGGVGTAGEGEVAEATPKGEAWVSFLGGLKRVGYFRGELEGSAAWRALLQQAVTYFRQVVAGGGSGELASGGVAALMDHVLRMQPRAHQEPDSRPGEGGERGEQEEGEEDGDDDESWLDVSPEAFEAMLAKMQGADPGLDSSGRATRGEFGGAGVGEEGQVIDDLVQGMQGFVQKVSSYKGAEVPRPCAPQRARSDAEADRAQGLSDGAESGPRRGHDGDEVTLDAERFLSVLTTALDPAPPREGGGAGGDGGDAGELSDESGDSGDDWDDPALFDDPCQSGGEGEGGQGYEGLSMQELMRLMDRELLAENANLSEFERVPVGDSSGQSEHAGPGHRGAGGGGGSGPGGSAEGAEGAEGARDGAEDGAETSDDEEVGALDIGTRLSLSSPQSVHMHPALCPVAEVTGVLPIYIHVHVCNIDR